jgi:RNA polymerase sigma factor (sigma-70 family)
MLNLAVLPEDNALAPGAVAGGAVRRTYAEPDAAARQCTPPAATAQSPRQQHSSARRRTGRGPMYPARTDAHPMCDDGLVTDLVTRARTGEKQAWDALVERYAPLIWSVCRRYRLGGADAGDVGQTVWLRLLEQLDKIRDPAALPGWLATTTQRECGRVLRAAWRPQALGHALEAGNIPDGQTGTAEHGLLLAERNAAVREAFMRLPPGGQRLIAMLIQDPPVPYAKISAELGIPVGSIGPIRRRCLEKLRRDPAIAALVDAEAEPVR